MRNKFGWIFIEKSQKWEVELLPCHPSCEIANGDPEAFENLKCQMEEAIELSAPLFVNMYLLCFHTYDDAGTSLDLVLWVFENPIRYGNGS